MTTSRTGIDSGRSSCTKPSPLAQAFPLPQTAQGCALAKCGPPSSRDLDSVGVGLADIRFGQATRDGDGLFYENVTEVFCKAQINDDLVMQPDLQFIANPGGNGQDALLAGIRFELVL